MNTNSRAVRVADQLQKELALLLKLRASDPRFRQVSITHVDISSDLINAKIYISLIDESQTTAIVNALNKAAGFFRHELAQQLDMRVTPKLRFIFDDTALRASRLDSLIKAGIRSEGNESD